MPWALGISIRARSFKKMIFFLSAFFYSFISNALAQKNSLDVGVLNEYQKIHKEFVATTCKFGVEETYLDLDKKYRGDGNFIPTLLDEKVDVKSIKTMLPMIKEKIGWINSQIEMVNKLENFDSVVASLKRLENEVQLLQEAKKDYFFTSDKEKRLDIEKKAEKQFEQMLKELESVKDSIPYLLSFKFPLNHLALRAEYEKHKGIATKESRQRANSIYLFRKIVQDGSYDENLTRNDSVIRAAFDTLYLSLTKEKGRSFLTENERSDFKYVLANLQILLDYGKTMIISRLEEWKKRTERSLAFYQDLQDGKVVKVEGGIKNVTSVLEERSKALYNLKDFVLKKEAEAYNFWTKQPEFFQSLYVLETILYAEVGRLDAPDALERRDVAQVVVNRSVNPRYNQIGPDDSIYNYLSTDIKPKNHQWLNVMFKEGEFSFTYFYIPGNFHIYCPDVSKVGQFLRRENVRIALEHLNKPRKNFPALRYFSRLSMFGRIEMDSLWTDYRAIGEVPGKAVKNPKKLSELFKQDRYKFLYDFSSEDKKKTYIVVEMQGKPYVVDLKNSKSIFYYRNPHQFRYFAPVK